MAKKAPKETGRGHEIITKAIFQALLDRDDVKSLDIRHNQKIQGKLSRHQIDVYWKFQSGGLDYETIVQVKKEKRPATKADIHAFEGVLNDIPGQPKAVFVTQAGYQRGALEHARKAGILLFQLSLSDITPAAITMTVLSFMKAQIVPDKMEVRWTTYNVNVRHVGITGDGVWAKEAQFPPNLQLEPLRIETLHLVNDVGQPPEPLYERVRRFAQRKPTGGEMLIEFTEPTYITGFKILGGSNHSIEQIKVLKMRLVVEVVETVLSRPLSAPNFAAYVLKNVLQDDKRYVLVEEAKPDPRAIVSLSLPLTRKRES